MWKGCYTPAFVGDALRILAEGGPDARIVAGGTDLLVELRREPQPDLELVDITRVDGLDRLWVDDQGLVHIGPAVTHNQVVASRLLVERGFPLALACWQVGTPQLRNRGTVAGNLVTASPANDTITALRALDARLTLRSATGERTLPLEAFYHGVRRTDLAPDEMVSGIAFPALGDNQRGVFVKLGLRRTHAIAVVNAAVVVTLSGERVSRARITLGSVAPTIIRAPEAERILVGSTLNEQCIDEAAALAAEAASPIDDIRAGAAYRRRAVRVLVRRALVALRDGYERDGLPEAPPKLWGETDGHLRPVTGETTYHRDQGAEPILCTVNGADVAVRGAGGKTLLQMLREDLGLTGAKEGCGEGECGACTVWMDDVAVFACLVPAPRAHGTHILTVEGLAPQYKGTETAPLHPVQQAFIDEGAVQCGFCTPGFVMAGANLLKEIPSPTREQIVAGLSGNLCRCTGYYKIVRAIERAAERSRHPRKAEIP